MRAKRRHHRQRLLDKMTKQNYYGMSINRGKMVRLEGSALNFLDGKEVCSDKHIRQHNKHNYNNRKACSCFMCGNPRKHFNEPTIQEKRAKEKFKFHMNEMGI